jgi:hypothetical protein
LARILHGFLTPDSDGDDLIQTHNPSCSSPALLWSTQDHDGQPSKLLDIPSSAQSIKTRDTTGAILEQRDEAPDWERQDRYGGVEPRNLSDQLHSSHVLSYLVKKTGEVAERLARDWTVRKAIVLVIIFIVLYQLCTTLIHALQADQVIV